MSKFYGIEAAPGKETKPVYGAPSEIFHLSVIAIPAGAQGHATLYATLDGSTFAVATLDSARKIFQVSVDMILPASQKPVLTVKGNVKLHLSGYVDDMNDAGMPDDEDFSEDGESEELSESDDETELPVEKATKALEAKKPEGKKAPAPAKEESDDEEDMDLEELDEEDLDGLNLDEEDLDGLGEEDEEDLDFDDEEMDFSSEEDESEDEEVAAPPATKGRVESGKPSGKPAPKAGKPQQAARQTGQKFGRV